MAAISKEDARYLAYELTLLMRAQQKHDIEKDNYNGNNWYYGYGKQYIDEMDALAESFRCALDEIIENKVKEMMNGLK